MALTDVAIRNPKPGAKPTKLADGSGMFLLVTPAGGKLWRLKYHIDGRKKLLAIGAYDRVPRGGVAYLGYRQFRHQFEPVMFRVQPRA